MIEMIVIFIVFLLLGFAFEKKQEKHLANTFELFFEEVPNFLPEDLNDILNDKDNIHITKHINDIFKNGETLLTEAIIKNPDPKIAEIFIKLGADVNRKNAKGISAMRYACLMADKDKINLLMKYGANLKQCIHDGDSLLIQVCNLCTMPPKVIIPLLINYGEEINKKGKGGMTALAHACAMPRIEETQLEMVKTLIEYGADVNSKSDDGVSILNIAVKNIFINLDVLRLLLDNNADIYSIDKNGYNVIMNLFAKNPNPLPILHLLSEYTNKEFDLNIRDRNGANLLMIAALNNPEPSVIDLLINLKVDPKAIDYNGYGLLNYAMQNPNKSMQQKIIDILNV